MLAATKADEAPDGSVDALREHASDLDIVVVSVLDDASLELLRERMWSLTGLVRVRLRHGDEPPSGPVALPPPVTVADVAHTIHHDIGTGFAAARVWGPSARFDGQRVGRDHRLQDGDEIAVEW
jgi:ribosome-interacting GTPase 1